MLDRSVRIEKAASNHSGVSVRIQLINKGCKPVLMNLRVVVQENDILSFAGLSSLVAGSGKSDIFFIADYVDGWGLRVRLV